MGGELVMKMMTMIQMVKMLTMAMMARMTTIMLLLTIYIASGIKMIKLIRWRARERQQRPVRHQGQGPYTAAAARARPVKQ